MAWPPQSGQGMKSAASSRLAAGAVSGSAGQVSQSMALAPMSAAIHRGVIARSSDSRTFRNASGGARKKVFL